MSTQGGRELEEHELVTEEAGRPQQPRRRLQRTYAKPHHATPSQNTSQLLKSLSLPLPLCFVCSPFLGSEAPD